jgi:hypothetical protein
VWFYGIFFHCRLSPHYSHSPLGLLRAGMKFTSLIPQKVMDKINSTMQEKGVPFSMNNLGKENVEVLIQNLSKMELNVIPIRNLRASKDKSNFANRY